MYISMSHLRISTLLLIKENHSEVRGALVALQQLAITFGIMVSFWID